MMMSHPSLQFPLLFKSSRLQSKFWSITVFPAEPPGVCVLLSVCPAGLCTEPESRLPPAGPSGSPGAPQTKSPRSPGLSARPASTAPVWVCLAPRSEAPAQSPPPPVGALPPAPPPLWSLSEQW